MDRRYERDALRSKIDELSEVHRRLTEILEAAAQIHDDDGQLAVVAGGADPNYHGVDFYPGNDNPSDEPDEYPMQWEHHYYLYNDTFGQQLTTPDGTAGYLQAEAGEAAGSGGDHGGQYLLSDPALYDDDDHDMIAVEATPARFSDGGFGGVPASAAAIASLMKQRHDGSGADSMCNICIRRYKIGKRLSVMPCAFKHRFHRKCLKKWLSRSHLCPLCRHALPTEDQSRAQATGTQHAWLLM